MKEIELRIIKKFWPGPLTLVLPRKKNVLDTITAGLETVAVRMPNHSQCLNLLQKTGPLVAPSANWIGKTWPIQNFSSLIQKLNKNTNFKNSYFIIVGPQNEKNSIKGLLKLKNLPIFDLVGKTDLSEIFLIMKKS